MERVLITMEGRFPQSHNIQMEGAPRFPDLAELGLGSRDRGVPPRLCEASTGQDSVTASREELVCGQRPWTPSGR